MVFEILFIPTKECVEDADVIDSSFLSKTKIIKLIGKGSISIAQWRGGCPLEAWE